MVQFLSFDEERHVITDNNSYWKLGLSAYQNARKTIKYLEEHGYRCRENASKAVTSNHVGNGPRRPMSYEGLSVSGLQSLCKAKGVSSKAKTASRLARALEKADDNATFRFLDLTAEIRNVIYELYFLDLPDLTSSHIQPPLTLASSVLRTEALPLFYGSSTFVFTILSNTDVDNCGYNTIGFSWGADKMMQMPAANLSQVKNFRVTWQEVGDFWAQFKCYEYLAVHLTHRNTVGKAVSVTGWVLQRKGNYLNDSLPATVCDFGCWKDDFSLQSKHIKTLAAAVPLLWYLR